MTSYIAKDEDEEVLCSHRPQSQCIDTSGGHANT